MVNTRSQIKKTREHSGGLISSSDDLLIEILLRLPLTSVLQFKCVSKHWRSLLSNPPFTLLYKNGINSPGLFVNDLYVPFDVEDRSPPPFRKLDFYPDRGIKIIQSCNGLLFCCSKDRIQRDCRYYVFNPTTKQFALIPSVPGGGNVRRTIMFMGLAFHQTDCLHYKVVCIRYVKLKRDEELLQIQIYSSETGRWKISNESFSAPIYEHLRDCVYWQQAIHLFSPCHKHWYFLNVDTEELKSMPLPLVSGRGSRRFYFGESRGHLHLVQTINGNVSHLHMNVFEMMKDYSGWFLKYQVNLDALGNVYPPMILGFHYFRVLDLVRGEEEDETFMVIQMSGKIIRYNVVNKSWKQIFELSTNFHEPVHRYTVTLVSV